MNYFGNEHLVSGGVCHPPEVTETTYVTSLNDLPGFQMIHIDEMRPALDQWLSETAIARHLVQN